VEERQGAAVQLHGKRVLAQLGAMFRVCTGAVRGQRVGLLAALHAGRAIRLEGHRVGAYQLKRLAHALRQSLHAQLGAELLAHLGNRLLPALASGAEVGRSGLVAVKLGDEFVEPLAGCWGLCYTRHVKTPRERGLRRGLAARVAKPSATSPFVLPTIIPNGKIKLKENLYHMV